MNIFLVGRPRKFFRKINSSAIWVKACGPWPRGYYYLTVLKVPMYEIRTRIKTVVKISREPSYRNLIHLISTQ